MSPDDRNSCSDDGERAAAGRRPGRAHRHPPRRGQPALQRRSRAGAARRAATGRPTTTRRCGSAWRTAFPTYMLASGLMASGMNWSQALVTILLGNTIVLDPDSAELASGHEVRHPVSGVRARRLRHARLERAGADARAGRVRLVRHPGVDRRRGAADVLQDRHPGMADAARRRRSPATRRPSGCRSCCSGASTSSSSTAAWICCARSRTGRRRSCS